MQSDLEEGMMADKEKISPQLFDLHQEVGGFGTGIWQNFVVYFFGIFLMF